MSMPDREKWNVLIVEDDEMVQTLYAEYLNRSNQYQLVDTLYSASMAEAYCLRKKIDVILMDVCTGLDASGIEAAAKIKRSQPNIKIIIITSQPEYAFMKRSREAGADSFWYKTPNEAELLDVLDRTMQGEQLWPEQSPKVELGFANSDDFTQSEQRILRELITGDTDEEIANTLHISVATVRKNVQNLLQKTGYKSRTQLAVKASNAGLVIKEF